MYDTVTLRMTSADAKGLDFVGAVAPRLHDLSRISDGKAVRIKGMIDNMTVTVRRDVLRVSGSLCKFYYGNNIERLTRKETKKAIEQLSLRVGVDLSGATVERVDVSANFTARQPLKMYNANIGNLQGAYKDIFGKGHGVTYKAKNSRARWALLFYDKARESKRDIGALALGGLNILRCELQLQSNAAIKALLGESVLYASDLWKLSKYRHLKDVIMKKINAIENLPQRNIAGEVVTLKDMHLKGLAAYCLRVGYDYVIAEYEHGVCKGLPPTETQRKAITRFKQQCRCAIMRFTESHNSAADELKQQAIAAIRAAK